MRKTDDRDVGRRDRITLFLCGDVMTGRGVDQVMGHPSDPVLYEPVVRSAADYVRLAERENGPIPRPVDPAYVWGDALRFWSDIRPDLRIINLETSVTTSARYWPDKGIHYRMHPDNASCFDVAGIDCCVLANNHVMDWGREGLDDTLATLDARGIVTAGAGPDAATAAAPARLTAGTGVAVLVYGFGDPGSGIPAEWRAGRDRSGINLLPDLATRTARRVAERLAAGKRRGELSVVSIHWGGNWGYDIPDEQRAFAHCLVDHGGVDVVHGHSSHHPKAVEIYRDKVILYGCGDFLNDYEGIGGYEHYRPWLSLMYFLTLDSNTGNIVDLETVPLQVRRMQLLAADKRDREWLAEQLGLATAHYAARFEVRGDRLRLLPTG